MTVGIGWLYVRFGGLSWMQAAFYGVGAAVIGIISRAAWKLAILTLARDRWQWAIFAVMGAVTAWTESEIAALFILCGVAYWLIQAPPVWLRRPSTACLSVVWPGVLGAAGVVLHQGRRVRLRERPGHRALSLRRRGPGARLADRRQFVDAVAVAMLTPGPVVITVAFIGYLVAQFPGAVAASVGVFLPVYLFVVVPFRWFDRISENVQVKAFVTGVTAAASGAIAGRLLVLARRAIIDIPTLLHCPGSRSASCWRFKVPEPVLIAAGAVVGPAHRLGSRTDTEDIRMKWVTREKARVDRIACPWLITRFIDKDPIFLFVPADQVHGRRRAGGGRPRTTFRERGSDTTAAELLVRCVSGRVQARGSRRSRPSRASSGAPTPMRGR